MSQTAQILHLVSNIELPEHTLVANTTTVSLINEIELLKKQESAIKKAIDAKVDKVKVFMGKAETLVTKDGIELATWKYVNATEIDMDVLKKEHKKVYNQVLQVDATALKNKFRDVFDLVAKTVIGARRFNVK